MRTKRERTIRCLWLSLLCMVVSCGLLVLGWYMEDQGIPWARDTLQSQGLYMVMGLLMVAVYMAGWFGVVFSFAITPIFANWPND